MNIIATVCRSVGVPPVANVLLTARVRRSSWCRYINHAPAGTCNLEINVDARRHLIWFVALRAIHVGEELHFNYGKYYRWGN